MFGHLQLPVLGADRAPATLLGSCGNSPGLACRLVWDVSHNGRAATLTSEFLAGPVHLLLRVLFVILLALVPIVIVALKETGGIHGLFGKLATQGTAFTHPWNGTALGGHNPFGDWIGIVFGLGFCL